MRSRLLECEPVLLWCAFRQFSLDEDYLFILFFLYFSLLIRKSVLYWMLGLILWVWHSAMLLLFGLRNGTFNDEFVTSYCSWNFSLMARLDGTDRLWSSPCLPFLYIVFVEPDLLRSLFWPREFCRLCWLFFGTALFLLVATGKSFLERGFSGISSASEALLLTLRVGSLNVCMVSRFDRSLWLTPYWCFEPSVPWNYRSNVPSLELTYRGASRHPSSWLWSSLPLSIIDWEKYSSSSTGLSKTTPARCSFRNEDKSSSAFAVSYDGVLGA